MELKYNEFKIKRLFINILLKKGKKTKSENIIKNILINIKRKTKQKPDFILKRCISNLMPKIKAINLPKKKKRKMKKNKKNKKNLYFLIFLNEGKQIKISTKWLLLNSKLENIVNEIIQTSKYKSKTINFKKQYYRNIKKLKFNLYY